MFDKIRISVSTFDNDIALIVETNNLKRTVRNQSIVTYDNLESKNFTGMFIKIDIDKKNITIEGSLHKYHSYLQTKKQENHLSNFTIKEAIASFELFAKNTNIDLKNAMVTSLEIGLNLYVSCSPTSYIELIKSIQPKSKKEPLPIIENVKYKNKSVVCTNMHYHNRKYYKIYDKNYELKEKRKEFDSSIYILRIESVYQRIDKLDLATLLHPAYLKELLNEFIETWQSLRFERMLIVPKGTTQVKTTLMKEVIESGGVEKVLAKYKKQLETKETTERKYRTIREFLQKEWSSEKSKIYNQPHKKELEFRNEFAKQIRKIKS